MLIYVNKEWNIHIQNSEFYLPYYVFLDFWMSSSTEKFISTCYEIKTSM